MHVMRRPNVRSHQLSSNRHIEVLSRLFCRMHSNTLSLFGTGKVHVAAIQQVHDSTGLHALEW